MNPTTNRTRVLVEDVKVGDTVITHTFKDGRIVPQPSVVVEIVEDNFDPAAPHRRIRCAGQEQTLRRPTRSSIVVLAA